jgi:hypothetical protein
LIGNAHCRRIREKTLNACMAFAPIHNLVVKM